MRLTALIALAGVAVLAACAMPPESAPTNSAQACDAADARELIGSHVGAVTFAPDKVVRIVCTTCPTTRDHRPDRLNVRFDQATGLIQSVDCG